MPGILLFDKNMAVDLYPEPIPVDSSLCIRFVQNDSGTHYLSYAAIAAMSFIKKVILKVLLKNLCYEILSRFV